MNYFDAHNLLNEVRDGHDHSESDITAALALTGDVDPDVCNDGVGWWGSIPKGWTPRVSTATLQGIGTRFSRVASHDHPTN
jgi:hypothetical protein